MESDIDSTGAVARFLSWSIRIGYSSFWRFLCKRFQKSFQDQGLWRQHTRTWRIYRQNGLPNGYGDFCIHLHTIVHCSPGL
uniref:Uncharacterized protein n=1 Tax=Brassica oleracea var. oleracea TaxID=109376 RepID=A0A0D3A6R5_BRAOL